MESFILQIGMSEGVVQETLQFPGKKTEEGLDNLIYLPGISLRILEGHLWKSHAQISCLTAFSF